MPMDAVIARNRVIAEMLTDARETPTPSERRAATTWAQRLKRVFGIDIETCREWGGTVKVIACIEDPVLMP